LIRAVDLNGATGAVPFTRETNAFSADNPRGAITINGNQFYMAGNADSSLNKWHRTRRDDWHPIGHAFLDDVNPIGDLFCFRPSR
jgi:hypothetical protein